MVNLTYSQFLLLSLNEILSVEYFTYSHFLLIVVLKSSRKDMDENASSYRLHLYYGIMALVRSCSFSM